MHILLKLRYFTSEAQIDSGRMCTTVRIIAVADWFGSSLRGETCWNMSTEKGVIVTLLCANASLDSTSLELCPLAVLLLNRSAVDGFAFLPAIFE